jgi:hypothetical protein
MGGGPQVGVQSRESTDVVCVQRLGKVPELVSGLKYVRILLLLLGISGCALHFF